MGIAVTVQGGSAEKQNNELNIVSVSVKLISLLDGMPYANLSCVDASKEHLERVKMNLQKELALKLQEFNKLLKKQNMERSVDLQQQVHVNCNQPEGDCTEDNKNASKQIIVAAKQSCTNFDTVIVVWIFIMFGMTFITLTVMLGALTGWKE